jgi:hypothetical protein
MSQKERKAYALLIIDMAAYDVQYRRTYASSFSNSTTSLKERMDIIMTPPKTKKFSRKLSVILTSCMVLCSSFTSFAYQPSTELDMLGTFSTNPLSNINSSDTVVFQSGDFQPENQYGPILYNNQFTDIFITLIPTVPVMRPVNIIILMGRFQDIQKKVMAAALQNSMILSAALIAVN